MLLKAPLIVMLADVPVCLLVDVEVKFLSRTEASLGVGESIFMEMFTQSTSIIPGGCCSMRGGQLTEGQLEIPSLGIQCG